MAKLIYSGFSFIILVSSISCHSKKTKTEEEVKPEQVQTPVTVITISTQPLTEYIELNATSSFIQDNIVKSNINGYIKAVNTKKDQFVHAGKLLFTLKTKEAESLGNTVNKLDPSFHFSGVKNIVAPQSGYVTQLAHQLGDYVQDGEQLAVISNSNSFGFVLNIPYEYRRYISIGKTVEVILPDSTHLNGTVSSFMPTIDSASQTQTALIKIPLQKNIPENLVAKVRILKGAKINSPSLPSAAVLTDEAQTNYWIMKMIDSVTAVKVPVIKGMETNGRIEIVLPALTTNDKIVLTGNYGLPDTAKVKIVKKEE